jgi:hypothetical protein
LSLIYERIKTAANVAMSNIARENNGYNEFYFTRELNKMKLVELKAACIHWKHFCDPELLSENSIPEIRSDLSIKHFIYIAMWLYIYIENKDNETFLLHSSNLNHIYKGYWIVKRREYWYNLGILHYTQHRATGIFMREIEHYNRILTELRRNAANGPRKFKIAINVCQDLDSCGGNGEVEECPICYEGLNHDTTVRNRCGHSICIGCFETYINTMIPKTSDLCCSICRCVIDKVDVCTDNISNIITKYTN